MMLDIWGPGDFLGENMFFEEGQYPVSAICLEDTLKCGFTRTQFEELMLKHPTVGLQVKKTLSERISPL
jgi:CRP/FNR family transcriptional regulator